MNEHEPRTGDPLQKSERERSNFIRQLVQRRSGSNCTANAPLAAPPKQIVQFWDDLRRLPADVRECMDSWKLLEQSGFALRIFDETSARDFILNNLGGRHAEAFDRCYHPSMKSDYFRYSYIYVEGGCYVDADDVYNGGAIDHLFLDGRLKLQPFCYDLSANQMVPPSNFTNPGANQWGWIFYLNTTPLIAPRHHPIVERALSNATASLDYMPSNELPEVQATTGPGNLTRSVFEVLAGRSRPDDTLLIVRDWETFSTSKWPLSYRNDKRNWRLSNQQVYRAPKRTGAR